MPDAEAVAKVLAGDLEAFAELVERHDSSVRACLRSIVGNSEDARDLKAECWESIFVKLREFDPSRDFRKWAMGFARRLGYERLRYRDYHPSPENIETVPEQHLPTLPGPEEEHERLLAEEAALRIVGPLPPEQQVAVLLCDGEGLTCEQVAELTARKLKTVESDRHRGLATLRKLAGRADETEGDERRVYGT